MSKKGYKIQSVLFCLEFMEVLESYSTIKIPYVDLHPNGEVMLCWHDKDIGMFSVSFSAEGIVYYAGFFVAPPQRPKGKVREVEGLLERIKNNLLRF